MTLRFATLLHSALVVGTTTITTVSTVALAALPGATTSTTIAQQQNASAPIAIPADVASALTTLPRAQILSRGADGIPTFLTGDLGHVGGISARDRVAAAASLAGSVGPALATLRLTPADLTLRKLTTDSGGNVHAHYSQRHDGLDVIGGDLVIHVDAKGAIHAINGTARGGFPSNLLQGDRGEELARTRLYDVADYAGMTVSVNRKVYFLSPTGKASLAYELLVSGTRSGNPVKDLVYVDAASSTILAVHPRIYFAESRRTYSVNHGTSLPGTLKRSEGGAANSDTDINAAYDNTGAFYEAYNAFWNRDSYDNAGATLISSVHYSTNYCNAFWNSSQMVYGDGNASLGCLPLTGAVEVTAHELTHAITENESALIYSGESGGLNEALSDIFGAFVEAYVDGGKTGTLAVSSDTWKVGEDMLPPFLRLMNDPAADGASRDYYDSSVGNLDVHYSSGIANLAFYLLSQGGTHPRNKSTVQVAAVGMDKAIRIFYKAQVDILTSNSNFLAAGNATVLAAQELGYSVDEQISVAHAWQAVGVSVPTPGEEGGGGGGNSPIALTNGVPVNGLSDSLGAYKRFTFEVPSGQSKLTLKISGGSGDADLYVRFGAAPTLSSFDCRPYLNGTAETCSFINPAAGTYYIVINAYADYSGVSLTGTYGAGKDDVTSLVNGGTLPSLSGATGSQTFYKIDTPAGKSLTITISGGSGDADLYTRFGSKPTLSTYSCRPYLNGNNERCTVTSTQAGSYYIMLRGYAAYSGVSLVAAY